MSLGARIAWDDTVLPFQLDQSDIRGRVARLDGVLDRALEQHDYPAQIEALVAEMTLLTALIGQTVKLRWKLSLQVRGDGPARLIATDYYAPTEEGAPARIRAWASFDERRLTDVIGYDGGPFFSPDGTHIVWRRFDAQGLIADVWTMKPDGTEARQITDFAAMSWAPYIHPSGQYLFFASNKLGFENFEIFMVDVEGTKEPVRVTYSDGFDGLPVPSPDGQRLAWTSNRGGGREGQIFLADWNHERAQAKLRDAPPRAPRHGASRGQVPGPPRSRAEPRNESTRG